MHCRMFSTWCGGDERKEVKCVSTFKFLVFKSRDLGGHVADSPASTGQLPFCFSASRAAAPNCSGVAVTYEQQ